MTPDPVREAFEHWARSTGAKPEEGGSIHHYAWLAWQAALSHPPAAAEPVAPADLRRSLWNAAVEACALVVQPIPHIEEERTCGEVAAAIRGLLLVAPSPQPTQQAAKSVSQWSLRAALTQGQPENKE